MLSFESIAIFVGYLKFLLPVPYEPILYRIVPVELYFTIGLENESQKYASLLGYNYQSSKWYEKSYKIFNKKYKSKLELKKEKKSMLKKFKKLFD